ncbi:MAG: glycosyltransferase family 2 protein [Candidatus Woesearchaeota archaeon]
MEFRKLSIIMPVFNEQNTIKTILGKVLSVKLPVAKEIIIVNDGSTDNSEAIILEFMKRHHKSEIKYFKKQNGGKGSAIRLGFSKATGDIITVQDADLEYEPEDFKRLLQPIVNNETKAVYGSRYIGKEGYFKSKHHIWYFVHLLGNWGLSLITSIVFFTKITDMETCYKMFTREVMKGLELKSDGFGIEPEITAKILRRGYKIKEIRINYKSRDFSEGKKITWRDGLKAFGYLLYFRVFD